MTELRSRTLIAGGRRTHLLEGEAGEPVLLIHGWPETSHEWRGVGARLAERFRVIAPDSRGHGRTEVTPTGSTRAELACEILPESQGRHAKREAERMRRLGPAIEGALRRRERDLPAPGHEIPPTRGAAPARNIEKPAG